VLALGHDQARIPTGDGITPVVVDLAAPLDDGAIPEFDSIVHLAQANVPFPDGAGDLFRVNVVSTQELLDLARRRGAERFVYASSGSVYGLGEGAVAEDDPRRADDFYSVTKRSGELVVGAYRDQVGGAVLRFFAPYGPGQVNRLIPGLIARVSNGDAVTLRGGGRPRMTPIYVDDVVESIVRALASSEQLVLNVAGDETVSIRDLGERIGAIVGRAPVFEDAGGEAPGDLIADNSRLHGLLGSRTLVPLDEGLRRTVEE
jgi:nucleoside-diphosphate-sugar epimerase